MCATQSAADDNKMAAGASEKENRQTKEQRAKSCASTRPCFVHCHATQPIRDDTHTHSLRSSLIGPPFRMAEEEQRKRKRRGFPSKRETKVESANDVTDTR